METVWNSLTKRWQDSLSLVLGLWLILSPWALGYAGIELAFWNAIILGIVISAVAMAALIEFQEWEEWFGMAFGAWLILSPWVLGFGAIGGAETATVAAGTAAATWNVLAVGALTIALAIWSLLAHRHSGTRTT